MHLSVCKLIQLVYLDMIGYFLVGDVSCGLVWFFCANAIMRFQDYYVYFIYPCQKGFQQGFPGSVKVGHYYCTHQGSCLPYNMWLLVLMFVLLFQVWGRCKSQETQVEKTTCTHGFQQKHSKLNAMRTGVGTLAMYGQEEASQKKEKKLERLAKF